MDAQRLRVDLSISIAGLINAALAKSVHTNVQFHDADPLQVIGQRLSAAGIRLDWLLSHAAIHAHRAEAQTERSARDSLRYLIRLNRPLEELRFTRPDSSVQWSLDPAVIAAAVAGANVTLEVLNDMALASGVPVFRLLGMRNLSSFVGEVFANELVKLERSRFAPVPHQDGYPDLLALTPEGLSYIQRVTENAQGTDKTRWSPYPFGGIEVKATCGSTPPAARMAKLEIGQSRWPHLTGADWKAHHQETNNLVGIFWDFIDQLPTILGVFYRNDLTQQDWGEIVKPKEGGGRTTSVSIMRKGRIGSDIGVKKMGMGWIILPEDDRIRAALCSGAVFCISERENANQLAL